MNSGVNSSLEVLFGKMDSFLTTETVVGAPINIGDVIIVPLVDISFGVGAGGSEGTEDKKEKDSGMGGLGAKITPSAVLVIMNGQVQLVNVKNQDSIGKLIDMAPGVLSKLNFGSFFSKDKKPKEPKTEEVKFTETHYAVDENGDLEETASKTEVFSKEI